MFIFIYIHIFLYEKFFTEYKNVMKFTHRIYVYNKLIIDIKYNIYLLRTYI